MNNNQGREPMKHRYNIILSDIMDKDLARLAAMLAIPKSEVIRRALVLYKEAVAAEKVELVERREGKLERVRVIVQ